MALIKVGFQVQGEKQAHRAFDDYGLRISSLREPLDRMADEVLAAVRLQFETEGASGLGHRWQKLSAEYEAWKDRHYPGRKILVRSGGMKGELLNKAQAVRVYDDRMVYEPRGKGGEIAGYHQTGHTINHALPIDSLGFGGGQPHASEINWGGLPQRKIVALSLAQRREAVDRVFAAWMLEQRKKAGLL